MDNIIPDKLNGIDMNEEDNRLMNERIAIQIEDLFDFLDLLRPGDPGDYEHEVVAQRIGFAFTDRLRNAEGVEVAAYGAALANIVTEFELACERLEREAARRRCVAA